MKELLTYAALYALLVIPAINKFPKKKPPQNLKVKTKPNLNNHEILLQTPHLNAPERELPTA